MAWWNCARGCIPGCAGLWGEVRTHAIPHTDGDGPWLRRGRGGMRWESEARLRSYGTFFWQDPCSDWGVSWSSCDLYSSTDLFSSRPPDACECVSWCVMFRVQMFRSWCLRSERQCILLYLRTSHCHCHCHWPPTTTSQTLTQTLRFKSTVECQYEQRVQYTVSSKIYWRCSKQKYGSTTSSQTAGREGPKNTRRTQQRAEPSRQRNTRSKWQLKPTDAAGQAQPNPHPAYSVVSVSLCLCVPFQVPRLASLWVPAPGKLRCVVFACCEALCCCAVLSCAVLCVLV